MEPFKKTGYLSFYREDPPKMKTCVVTIKDSTSTTLGHIKWYPQWRKYCFFPTEQHGTIFDAGCLNTIKETIEELMSERKQR